MQKAKYEVVVGSGDIRYTAITTTRDTEDMVRILRERFDEAIGQKMVFPYKIMRTSNGERVEVYNNKKPTRVPTKPPKPQRNFIKVIDNATGEVFDNIAQCARAKNLCRMSLYRMVQKNEFNSPFSKYKEKEETDS